MAKNRFFKFKSIVSYPCCVLLCIAICCAADCYSQSVRFTHLTNLDGLSQSTVKAIVKDNQGFMWFGTEDGLNRYDGYNFKVYRHQPKDSTSLRRSHINTLYIDRSDNLWVGTANGALSLYDRRKDAFIHFKESTPGFSGLSQKSVTAIYEDQQHNFWVGTFWKLNLLDRKTGKVVQFANDAKDTSSISSDFITCITEDSRGNLWVGTSAGLNLMDRNTKKFKRFLTPENSNGHTVGDIRTIYEDSSGRLWVGTTNGLNLFNYGTGRFTRYIHVEGVETSLFDNRVNSIQDAPNGNLWVGTQNSLELFDTRKQVFIHHLGDRYVSTALNKNGNITALLWNDGILWAGTYQGGINKFDVSLTYFDSYSNNPRDAESLSFNIVNSFAESPDGNIWIATGGGALNLWKRAENKFIRFNPDPANKNSLSTWGLLSVYQGKKNNYLWIGTYGSCVDRYDPATNTFKHYTKGDGPDNLNNDAVYAIFEDSRGNIWMGTNGGGVNVLDQATGTISKYVNDPNNKKTVAGNFVRCFFEDRSGKIWIGSTGGASVYDPVKEEFTQYNQDNFELESDVVHSLYGDKEGNIWIGTLGGGLNKLNPATKKITGYTTSDGLPDNTINSIIEDEDGRLWLSTNNGLSRFDPKTGVFKNCDLNNGIQSFEFSPGAGIRTSKGEIIFGGVNGFNVLSRNNVVENQKIPPVVITDCKLFYKSLEIDSRGMLPENILLAKTLRIPHDQSIITFEFAALGFTSPEKNQYAYMLEGIDKNWNYAGNSRQATYTNLNPGEYIFRVKAANNDGVWNEQGTSVKLIVTPPFWNTWWFKSLLALAVVGIVLFVYNMRVRAIHAQNEDLEQQVQERTQSLAAMTREERKARQLADEANRELERKNKELEQFAYVASHDLQEPLRTTSTSAEMLQRFYKGKLDERADKYLGFITQSTERMRTLISDLLEYSRIGKKKELKSVDCNQVVQEVLADLGAAIDEAGASITHEYLPVVFGYPTELKQLFQNLIINAIKFRKKNTSPEIRISSEKLDGYWKFAVADNGIGMDPQYSEKIFIIFQRLHSRNEYPGSGIGLSHCKKIAELHKGKIWVDSEPNKGSTFHFTIGDRAGEGPEIK
jgi:signal transduction histidine kinase/ligand-binding sensor domain-containing protein